MSRADELFIKNCRDILENGVWDTDLDVRPRWEDGSPAHTVKRFGVVNRYDLSAEFPILTIRRTFWKSAVDELLWIWQQKSNNVHELRSRVWDAWADGTGSIGRAYGYQLGVKYSFPEGESDQVDHVPEEDAPEREGLSTREGAEPEEGGPEDERPEEIEGIEESDIIVDGEWDEDDEYEDE